MKKILSFVLALLMLLSLTACLDDGTGNNTGHEDDMSPGQQAYIENQYDEDGKLIISFFGIDLDTLQAQTEETKRIMDYIENKFNVKFKFLTATTSGWKNVLNQYIGAGEAPDIFFHTHDEPAYSTWLQDNYLFNFSTLLDDYPNLKAAFERYPVDEMKGYLGGDYYSYPVVMDQDIATNSINEHALYYRVDWYKNLVAKNWKPSSGRELVNPTDPSFNYLNFYDLCEGYTKGDPDNNGLDDTYGYALTKDGGVYWWYPLFSLFGVNWDGWHQDESGNWVPDCTSDDMKEALFFIADMYDKGFINSNYATTATQAVMKNEFVNGLAGMMCYNATYPMGKGILDLMKAYTTDGKELSDIVQAMPVPTNSHGEKTMFGYSNYYGFRAINNDIGVSKKKKILEIMEWMLSEEGQTVLNYGLEGIHYERDDQGNIVSKLGLDKNGYPKTLYDESVAPGIYRIKGLVSWDTLIPDVMEDREEQLQLLTAWENQYLDVNPLGYVSVDPSYALTISQLNDMIEISYKEIVSKTTDEKREKIWNDFVKKYNVIGNSYINAVNEKADEIVK